MAQSEEDKKILNNLAVRHLACEIAPHFLEGASKEVENGGPLAIKHRRAEGQRDFNISVVEHTVIPNDVPEGAKQAIDDMLVAEAEKE
jgi:hypothetical protein